MLYKIKLNKDIFFYIGLIIQIFYVLRIITINLYANSEIYTALIIIFFSISILLNKYNEKEIIIMAILLLCALIHLYKTYDMNLLRIVMLIFAGKGINIHKFKKFLAIIYPLTFFGVWFLSQYYNLNTIYQENVWRTSVGWETRYTFGFDGPTRMMFIWICCIVSIQIYTHKINLIRDLTFLIFSIYLFSVSISYTGIVVAILAICLPYGCRFLENCKDSKVLKFLIPITLLIVLGLTFIASFINISQTSLGKLLNGRTFYLYHLIAIGVYPSLFGSHFSIKVAGLDNSYFYNFYILGIVPMIIMLIAIIKLGKVYYKKRDFIGLSCTAVFIIMAYVTQTFEVPFLNYFLFLIIENWKEIININFVKSNLG